MSHDPVGMCHRKLNYVDILSSGQQFSRPHVMSDPPAMGRLMVLIGLEECVQEMIGESGTQAKNTGMQDSWQCRLTQWVLASVR